MINAKQTFSKFKSIFATCDFRKNDLKKIVLYIMKKNLLLITLLSFSAIYSQNTDTPSEEINSDSPYNRWTIEVFAGQAKGLRPFSQGYSSSDGNKFAGKIDLNSFNLGARYMMSPKFGIKADFAYDLHKNSNSSKPFKVEQLRFDIQAVVNASRLFGIEENLNRFGLLIHSGLAFARVTPKLDTGIDNLIPKAGNVEYDPTSSNVGKTEYNLGLIIGITPQYRFTNRLAAMLDFSTIGNYRQHFAWDGHYSQESNNLDGAMIAGTIGLSYSLGDGMGKEDEIVMHGDWAPIEDKRLEEITELDNRINDLETLMNDTDKDGVPDYLDVENNSIAGVTVDTKGRMIDTNKNGVPDELEKLVTMTTSKDGVNGTDAAATQANATNTQMISKLINEGYVTVYFDYDKTDPTEASTEGIDFMLTYLRNNPEGSIEIFGNADELGNSDYNNKLANNRAANVKKILIDAGIKANRLDIISRGEDNSVNPNSALARRLVRKVSFKIKK
jgi:OmpA-OmpF porin, OOP family